MIEINLKNLEKNVYKDYNSSMIGNDFRSKSERLFKKHCEKNENVEFIYKNGDIGRAYFSIVYANNFDKQKLFYLDYIVKLKNDELYINNTEYTEDMFNNNWRLLEECF